MNSSSMGEERQGGGEMGKGNGHKWSSRTGKLVAVNTTLEINLWSIMIFVITILCLHLVHEMPRGANILRNISNMFPSMLSDQQMQPESQKEQLLLVWMVTEGLGMGQEGSTISVQVNTILSISLGCWLQKQWVLASLHYFTQRFVKYISFSQM